MKIRKATLADSKAIPEHLFLAMEKILYRFMGIRDRKKAIELLEYFVARENNQYSFQNCLVAELDDQVVGCINIYDGARLDWLREPVIHYVKTHYNKTFDPERETQAGEYYIDSFGVSPDQQGKGIGTKLLQFAIKTHTIDNHRTLGLLVDEKNPEAKKLYIKLGFKPVERITFMGSIMEHLQIRAV